MMKKYIVMLMLLLANFCMSQSGTSGYFKPAPSVSSLSTYVNTPVTYATGVPDISYPLASLNTLDKDFSLKYSLSYHPHNVLSNESASDVGLGWTLLGHNVISREIVVTPDELEPTSFSHGFHNDYNDNYLITLNGVSCKFRVNRDFQTNLYTIEKLSPSQLKIEYERESVDTTLIFKSFTITDDYGYKYFFDQYSTSAFNGRTYKSAFYVSKIFTPNQQEIARFEYQKDLYQMTHGAPYIQSCKPKKAISHGYGSIEFDYALDTGIRNDLQALNDPYSITTIYIKNTAGMLINSYSFSYTGMNFKNPFQDINIGSLLEQKSKRILSQILKSDRNNVVSEATQFTYNTTGSSNEYSPVAGQFMDHFIYTDYCTDAQMNEILNPKYFPYGTLQTVTLPTGGKVEYNFESNQYYTYKDQDLNYGYPGNTIFTDPEIQNLKKTHTINFDTNVANTYNIDINVNPNPYYNNVDFYKTLYIKFKVNEMYPYPPQIDLGGTEPNIGFTLPADHYNNFQHKVMCKENNEIIERFLVPNGTLPITISPQAVIGGNGYFEVYELENVAPFNTVVSKHGVRIKNIKTFEKVTDQNPATSQTFEYQKFNTPSETSGILYSTGKWYGNNISHVIYSNIKVTEANGGYQKYYYKTPDDILWQSTGENYPFDKYMPFIEETKGGILQKKEAYTASDNLLLQDIYDSEFQELPFASSYYIITGSESQTYKTKASFIKKLTVKNRIFSDSNQFIEKITETNFNNRNLKPESEKTTYSSDEIFETNYKYPHTYVHQRLMAANIFGTVVSTEHKKNGVIVSKSENKYDNNTHLFPTSVVSFDLQNTSATEITYNEYDAKGNLLQYTLKDGISTAIVWGYYSTQPIAKITGATYAQVSSFATDIVMASDSDADNPSSEGVLIIALDNFRKNAALSGYQITTYTYDPLIGVTSITPPSGIREIYHYDSANRLQKIINVNGKVLREYNYNYKP
ncbi:MAG: hypothetical protein EOO20_07875 [Chryseobacterium sp.]|nr:MAG: hypothetical protein EOO20_07875 [Chryseobacterium sp.]